MEAGPENRAGLEERVRRKLGLLPTERTILIEHILLRPIADDRVQDVPLLAEAKLPDPYSLQFSFVFRKNARVGKAAFRRFAERTLRDETPAHLTPHIHWIGGAAWEKLDEAWRAWVERRRSYWTSQFNVREPLR